MALTPIQRSICRVLADSRLAAGESYVGGGSALNEWLRAPRVSHDVDLFHDTSEALLQTWRADRQALEARGYDVRVAREHLPTFVEATVGSGDEAVVLQWVRDSAYRFFPLLRHEVLGLTLHPFDAAANKVLALVGRVEVRDWIDVIECHQRLQPLGYLAWAACGKDPGFSPATILEEAARSARYSQREVDELVFEGPAPDAAELSQTWHAALAAARDVVRLLPPENVGKCVLAGRDLCRVPAQDLPALLRSGSLAFHEGRIRGAWPTLLTGLTADDLAPPRTNEPGPER